MWRDSCSCLSFSGSMKHIELIISSSLLLVIAQNKCEWTSEGLNNLLKCVLSYVIVQLELQLWKDVNKTTCKKCVT